MENNFNNWLMKKNAFLIDERGLYEILNHFKPSGLGPDDASVKSWTDASNKDNPDLLKIDNTRSVGLGSFLNAMNKAKEIFGHDVTEKSLDELYANAPEKSPLPNRMLLHALMHGHDTLSELPLNHPTALTGIGGILAALGIGGGVAGHKLIQGKGSTSKLSKLKSLLSGKK